MGGGAWGSPGWVRAALWCGSLLVLELAYLAWRGRGRARGRARARGRKEVHEVVMFPARAGDSEQERPERRVVRVLERARRSLDVCMYVVSSRETGTALAALLARGVRVRLVVDADLAHATGSQLGLLARRGALVRHRRSTDLMHHKFCLVDASLPDEDATPLLMTGSLNWTRQALNGNWEDVLVTSQEALVKGYMDEFEKLWEEFKPDPLPAP